MWLKDINSEAYPLVLLEGKVLASPKRSHRAVSAALVDFTRVQGLAFELAGSEIRCWQHIKHRCISEGHVPFSSSLTGLQSSALSRFSCTLSTPLPRGLGMCFFPGDHVLHSLTTFLSLLNCPSMRSSLPDHPVNNGTPSPPFIPCRIAKYSK